MDSNIIVLLTNDDLALERIINVPIIKLGTNTTSLIHSYARKNNISFCSLTRITYD